MWAKTPRLDASLMNSGFRAWIRTITGQAASRTICDQFERVLRALAEPDERDVGSLSCGHGGHVLDLDLAGDHFMSEFDHDRRDEREAVLAFVGDQDAQMLGVAVVHDRFYRDRV